MSMKKKLFIDYNTYLQNIEKLLEDTMFLVHISFTDNNASHLYVMTKSFHSKATSCCILLTRQIFFERESRIANYIACSDNLRVIFFFLLGFNFHLN